MSRATVLEAEVTQTGNAQRAVPQAVNSTGYVLPANFVDDADQTITPDPVDDEGD